jgi:hypothetical protein
MHLSCSGHYRKAKEHKVTYETSFIIPAIVRENRLLDTTAANLISVHIYGAFLAYWLFTFIADEFCF